MRSNVLSHRDLKVWQKAIDLLDRIYDVTSEWPKHELYGLTSQIRRAGVSVPSNIAEGNGRLTTPDYIRFLYLSYGSLMEVDTQVFIARRRAYLTAEVETDLTARVSEVGRMLNGLIKSLRKRHEESPE